jgi:peptide/nickel transport system substrate-binding protein
MKKILFVSFAILLIFTLLLSACGKDTSTSSTTSTTKTSTTSTTQTSTTSTSTPAATPVKGGTLREITGSGPMSFSNPKTIGPGDEIAMAPAVERLADVSFEGGEIHYEPSLCESYKMDLANKTLTFNLRKGVKFHDGSEMTAEVVVWNFNLGIKYGKIQEVGLIDKIEATDKYTVVLHWNTFSNRYEDNWAWLAIRSQAAWEAAGGGEASETWGNTHIVGTGPFKLGEYKRDSYLTWVKFDDYWQKGKPYLDGITVTYVPDSTIASLKMEANEADMWNGGTIRDQLNLVNKGQIRQYSWAGGNSLLIPNTVDPGSKWNDIRVREALEYAIDKKGIAKALGLGYFVPLTMISMEWSWGFDPTYTPREYNIQKAKQLLADAGYPNGIDVTLMITSSGRDAATAIANCVEAAGIRMTQDEADMGRFYGSLFGKGWPDLIMGFSGEVSCFLSSYIDWFSSTPKTNMPSMGRSAEQKALEQGIEQIVSIEEQKAKARQLQRFLMDNAVVCPLWYAYSAYIVQPYVHTDYLTQGPIRWMTENVWMDKH